MGLAGPSSWRAKPDKLRVNCKKQTSNLNKGFVKIFKGIKEPKIESSKIIKRNKVQEIRITIIFIFLSIKHR